MSCLSFRYKIVIWIVHLSWNWCYSAVSYMYELVCGYFQWVFLLLLFLSFGIFDGLSNYSTQSEMKRGNQKKTTIRNPTELSALQLQLLFTFHLFAYIIQMRTFLKQSGVDMYSTQNQHKLVLFCISSDSHIFDRIFRPGIYSRLKCKFIHPKSMSAHILWIGFKMLGLP